jgi:methyl-accepting chemotaxis protein WspA
MNLRPLMAIRGSIVGRLMFWFLVIALVPCGALTAVVAYLSSRSLEITVRDRLKAIAEAKRTQLETYARERRGDALILGRAPTVVQAVNQLNQLLKAGRSEAPEFHQEIQKVHSSLSYFVDVYGYTNIYLFNPEGDFLISDKPGLDPGRNLLTGPLRNKEFAEAFQRARMLLQPVISDYQLYPGHDEPMAFLAGPVLDGNRLAGIAVFEFGNQEVFKVFHDYGGLGETGETMVAIRVGDELTYVGPSRSDPSAPMFRRGAKLGSAIAVPMQLAVQGQRGYGRAIDYRGVPVVAVWSFSPSFRWGMVVQQDVAEAFELLQNQKLVTIILLIITVTGVILAARTVARSISRPIQEAARVAQQIAAGDLTAQITATAPGEAGQLLEAIHTMTLDLRSIIGQIQQSSIALLSTATEIAATAKQQEHVVQEYGASTNEAVAAVREISATSQELRRTMSDVNHVASQTAAMAVSGKGSLEGMGRTMRQLADATGSISAKLAVINERAANINLIVTTITKVADQTNLLSINAAIEAEKAGEYGLGFLVVAREIRRLADQTAVATLDIERMVKEMQYSVSAGVMEMDKFSEQVRQGVSEVGKISEQLSKIIGDVETLTQRFEQVNEGMRAQSEGAEQIREAMVHLSKGSNQIATSLSEFNRATDHLRDAVSGLKEEVSRFTLTPAQLPSRADGAPVGDRESRAALLAR